MIGRNGGRFFVHGKKAWFLQHQKDMYVRKSQEDHYRSRAAYKLLEIEEKFHVLGKNVLDLGCAPGSWCQVARKSADKVVGVDLLEMKEIQGVQFHQMNAVSDKFEHILQKEDVEFDVVLSDMAPNFSGDLASTHEETLDLNKMTVYLASKYGKEKCDTVMKTISGTFEKQFFWVLSMLFEQVHRYKPPASRAKSAEFYYVLKSLHPSLYKNIQLSACLKDLDFESLKSKKSIQKVINSIL